MLTENTLKSAVYGNDGELIDFDLMEVAALCERIEQAYYALEAVAAKYGHTLESLGLVRLH